MPYSVKGFFEINEDMVQILLMLEVLFTQDSKVEDLFYGASSDSNPNKNKAKKKKKIEVSACEKGPYGMCKSVLAVWPEFYLFRTE